MSSIVILAEYQGMSVSFDHAGWFNATTAAKKFNKLPAQWMRLPETCRYIKALARSSNVQKSHFARSQRGGRPGEAGTWLHPKLAVRFAQWLDVDFAVWCDTQIEQLIHGQALLPVGLYAQRIAFEGMKAKSEQKGTIGARLMNERKREKPSLVKAEKDWRLRMEPGLFALPTRGAA